MKNKIIRITIAILLILSPTVYSEQKEDITTDKELEEIYKNLPPELKGKYKIPEDFFKEYKGDEPPGEKEEKEKEKEKKKPEEIKKEEEKKETKFEKILNFIFGSTKTEIRKPDTKPDIQEESEKQPISFETVKSEIKNIDQIKNLKPLETIIRNAIKNSPDVKKAKIESEIIKRQNTFTPVPTFNIGNDLLTGKTNISAGIQLPLEPLFLGKQKERYAAMNVIQKEKEVEQKVIEQYKLVLITSKKLEKKREKTEYTKQLNKNAEEQYKGGIIKLNEVIAAKDLQWQTETDEENLTMELQTQIEKLYMIEQGGK